MPTWGSNKDHTAMAKRREVLVKQFEAKGLSHWKIQEMLYRPKYHRKWVYG